LRRAITPRRWVQPLAASAPSEDVACAAQSRSLRASRLSPASPMPKHRRRPLSPRGCLRTRLGIGTVSLRADMIRASRSPGRRTPRFRRAGVEWRCLRRGRAAYTRRPPCGSQSDRSLRGERRRSNGKETTLCSCCADLAVFRGVLRLGRPYVLGTVQVAPTPRIRRREVQRHGGSEAHGAKTSRPSKPQAGIGCVLVCCRLESPDPAYEFGWYRRIHLDARAAESLVRCILDVCVQRQLLPKTSKAAVTGVCCRNASANGAAWSRLQETTSGATGETATELMGA
jgi:hypothetical protein